MDEITELQLRIYDEERTHVRHHLSQVTNVANFVVAASAVALGVAGSLEFRGFSWILGLFVSSLAVYGFMLSRKMLERFRFHNDLSDRIFDEIAKKNSESGLRSAFDKLETKYKKQRDYKPSLSSTWKGIYLILFFIGIAIIVVGLTRIQCQENSSFL